MVWFNYWNRLSRSGCCHILHQGHACYICSTFSLVYATGGLNNPQRTYALIASGGRSARQLNPTNNLLIFSRSECKYHGVSYKVPGLSIAMKWSISSTCIARVWYLLHHPHGGNLPESQSFLAVESVVNATHLPAPRVIVIRIKREAIGRLSVK